MLGFGLANPLQSKAVGIDCVVHLLKTNQGITTALRPYSLVVPLIFFRRLLLQFLERIPSILPVALLQVKQPLVLEHFNERFNVLAEPRFRLRNVFEAETWLVPAIRNRCKKQVDICLMPREFLVVSLNET